MPPPGTDPAPTSLAEGEGAAADVDRIRRRAATGALTLGLRSVAVRGLGFAGNIVLARLLVPSDFGAIALGLTAVTLGRLLADAGVGAGFIRREQPPTRPELRSLLGFQLAIGGALAVVLAAVCAPLGREGLIAAIMVAALPIDATRAPAYITLERDLRFRTIAQVDIAETVLYNVAAVGAVALGAGVVGVAAATLAKSIFGAVLLAHLGPVGLIRPSFRLAPLLPVLRFGAAFQGSGAVLVLRDQAVNVTIGAVGGITALGYWALANRLLQPGVVAVDETVGRVLFPAIARLREAGERLDATVTKTLGITYIACGLMLLPVVGAAPALVPALFGEQWTPSVAVLTWTASGFYVLSAMALCTQSFLWAVGRAGLVLKLTIFKALLMLAVTAALLPREGPVAAGIALCVTAATDVLLSGTVLYRLAEIKVVPVVLRAVIIGAASVGAGRGVLAAIDGSDLVEMFAAGGATAMAFALLACIVLRDAALSVYRLLRRTLLRSDGTPSPEVGLPPQPT